jgi:hypothetical protein
LNVTVTGGSAAGMVVSNYFVTDTNLFVWDLAKVQKLGLRFETNMTTLQLSNAYFLTNGEAQLSTWEDTNGVWKVSNVSTLGGLTRTNGNGLWRGTNASQDDEAVLRMDGTGTNVWFTWNTNLQPVISFTNSLAGGGGGGGGGGAFTLLGHMTTNLNGTLTTSAFSLTGAKLVTASISYFNGATSFGDSGTSSYTKNTVYGGTGGSYSNVIYYSTAPSVSGSETFTITATLAVVDVAWWSYSGTTPAKDVETGLNYAGGNTTTLQPGSLTPAGNNELFLTAFVCNDLGTSATNATINSSYTITDQAKEGANQLYGGMAYLIQGTGAAVNPTWTFANTIDVGALSHIAFK